MEEEEGRKQQLLIKLKIPKLEVAGVEEDDDLEEGEIREEEEEEEEEEDRAGLKELKPNSSKSKPNPPKVRENSCTSIRVCPECFKEFSSGKALGGHMRVHVQQQSPTNSNSNSSHKKKKYHHKLKPTTTTRFKKPSHNPNKLMVENQQPDYMRCCVDGNGQPVCSLCGKNFPSIKSLFGHMRCHPEREWRGILPPPTHDHVSSLVLLNHNRNKTSSSSSLSDEPNIEVASALPRWAVRAKRGRKAVVTPTPTPTPEEISTSCHDKGEVEEEVQLLDAVQDLMRLAQGDQSFDESGLTHKQQRGVVDEIVEATNSNSLTGSASMDNEGKGKGNCLGVVPMKLDLSDKELSDSNEQLLINYKHTRNGNCESSNNVGKFVAVKSNNSPNNNKRKRKKTKPLMDLEPVQIAAVLPQQVVHTGDKYICSTCNKSFPTHQALGGHRSSHNKFKMNITNAEDKKKVELDEGFKDVKMEDVNVSVAAAAAMASGSSSTHQCKICDKIFPTGQALGGHKRCHWTGPAEPEVEAVAQPEPEPEVEAEAEAEGEGEKAAGERKVMDFDLNVEPPPEDDYAYSSCNSNIG